MAERFGWSDQANCRSWQLGRRRAASPVRWERRHPAGLGQATEDQEGKEGSW